MCFNKETAGPSIKDNGIGHRVAFIMHHYIKEAM